MPDYIKILDELNIPKGLVRNRIIDLLSREKNRGSNCHATFLYTNGFTNELNRQAFPGDIDKQGKTPTDEPKFGDLFQILYDGGSGEDFIYTYHSAVYLGKDANGRDYVFSQKGYSRPFKIDTIDEEIKEYESFDDRKLTHKFYKVGKPQTS